MLVLKKEKRFIQDKLTEVSQSKSGQQKEDQMLFELEKKKFEAAEFGRL